MKSSFVASIIIIGLVLSGCQSQQQIVDEMQAGAQNVVEASASK
jgi:hypothetical protein